MVIIVASLSKYCISNASYCPRGTVHTRFTESRVIRVAFKSVIGSGSINYNITKMLLTKCQVKIM